MRTLRLLALAAAMVVPAAAAHAQVGVYVGPSVRYAAPAYGPVYGARVHWDHRIYGGGYWGRPYVGGPWIAPPVYRGYHDGYGWRGGRGWAHDGRYARGGRW